MTVRDAGADGVLIGGGDGVLIGVSRWADGVLIVGDGDGGRGGPTHVS